jgi:hypothetical protein
MMGNNVSLWKIFRMKYSNIREEELKNRVAGDFFDRFDATEIIDNIDFAIRLKRTDDAVPFGDEYLLWAEAKAGSRDLCASFVQLILTIGQSGTVGNRLPPPFLGAFDAEKTAFIPYIDIADVFAMNDFNWKVTPSNHESKEFRLLYDRVQKIIEERMYRYDFEKDETALRHFINNSLAAGHTGGKIQITKNNFIHIYLRWLDEVKPHINFNWEGGKKAGVLDCDFYRADLFVDDKDTECVDDDAPITDRLSVIFRGGKYCIVTEVWGNNAEMIFGFHHGGKEHYTAFWKKYKRPPLEEFQEYIIDRRDLLVPQDIRERKGSFFTPKIWVELSQEYLAGTLGADWQDEYYIWDCAAGTGNLLAGLTNKYHIWASTLDKADVDVMKERIHNGANLLEEHVFEFDFLNDDFLPKSKGGKLPDNLYGIINDPKRRKKLVVYINPPYAEAGNARQKAGTGENKAKVSDSKTYTDFQHIAGTATRELFAQFFLRIYKEIPDSILASFSKLKYICAPNFIKFREYFLAKYRAGFICKASTFDNVSGLFPIAFLIWDLSKKEMMKQIKTDVANSIETKTFYAHKRGEFSIDWLRKFFDKNNQRIGFMRLHRNDIQNKDAVYITSRPKESDVKKKEVVHITIKNLIEMSIYLTIRKVIPATWLNDRDQFLYPNKKWEKDVDFQNDCLAYTLFDNNISSKHGANHWIPFRETEVDAPTVYDSHIMITFLSGKIIPNAYTDLFSQLEDENKTNWRKGENRQFSIEAQAVFSAARELWKYYFKQPKCNVNASLYDIREHFQGRNEKGKMNNKSDNETYNGLIAALRAALKTLAGKIEPKVYEYGFLK